MAEDDEAIDQYYQMVHRDDLINPFWLENACLKQSDTQLLDEQEITFWKKFIKKYLAPLDKDEDKEKKIAADLKVWIYCETHNVIISWDILVCDQSCSMYTSL